MRRRSVGSISGMRYQHSFWYSQSKGDFRGCLKADPNCVIAYWGIGQSLLANPFNRRPAKNLSEGLAALTKAKEIGAGTPREGDLIAALTVYYTDHDSSDQRTRVLAYAKAMEAVAGRHKDDEVQIYYALALDVAASPSDKTYASQLKAAAILEPIFQRQPHHTRRRGALHRSIPTTIQAAGTERPFSTQPWLCRHRGGRRPLCAAYAIA
jgi:hypothetical protein